MSLDEAGVGPWMVDPEMLLMLRLDKAVRALDADDPDLALVEAEELLHSRPGHVDALGVVGRAALQMGDAAMARAALERLWEQGARDAVTALLLSQARFGTAELEGAVEAARCATDTQPDLAAAWFQQALALERLGRAGAAALAWQRAHALDGERFRLPGDVPEDVWVACLDAALGALPDPVRGFYARVPVRWATYPTLQSLRQESPPLSPLLDAMYTGSPPLDPEERLAHLPEAVTLFRGNLRLPDPQPAALAHRILAALVHEAQDWLGLPPEDHTEPG
jgi:tetratricopeptide (TPR) repeat protein